MEGVFHHDPPSFKAKRSVTQDNSRLVKGNWLNRLSLRFRHLLFSVFCLREIAAGGGFLVLFLVFWVVSPVTGFDDSYIAGYATAVLQREFSAAKAIPRVKMGVVSIDSESLAQVDQQKAMAVLESIPGVVRVEIQEGKMATDVSELTPISKEPTKLVSNFLPRDLLVAPFHADPRWPHFSILARRVGQGQEPRETGSANFGETWSLYRDAIPSGGQWEIAIQSAVFSMFNLAAPSRSKDLVNADYTVGLLSCYRSGPFSGFLRLHHQSSHLGDEYILNSRTPIKRVNLSFEELDLKMSYELANGFRVYGGMGRLLGVDPKNLGRGTGQLGAEFASPKTLGGGKIRPVAYVDAQANEKSQWKVAKTFMAGFQFEDARIGDRKVQLLAEYFSGPSPNGQFFRQNTRWIGFGLHLYY
jgi:hypothetical protein